MEKFQGKIRKWSVIALGSGGGVARNFLVARIKHSWGPWLWATLCQCTIKALYYTCVVSETLQSLLEFLSLFLSLSGFGGPCSVVVRLWQARRRVAALQNLFGHLSVRRCMLDQVSKGIRLSRSWEESTSAPASRHTEPSHQHLQVRPANIAANLKYYIQWQNLRCLGVRGAKKKKKKQNYCCIKEGRCGLAIAAMNVMLFGAAQFDCDKWIVNMLKVHRLLFSLLNINTLFKRGHKTALHFQHCLICQCDHFFKCIYSYHNCFFVLFFYLKLPYRYKNVHC